EVCLPRTKETTVCPSATNSAISARCSPPAPNAEHTKPSTPDLVGKVCVSRLPNLESEPQDCNGASSHNNRQGLCICLISSRACQGMLLERGNQVVDIKIVI